jgi:hypothetical protein
MFINLKQRKTVLEASTVWIAYQATPKRPSKKATAV